jgi:Fic family protein
VARVIRRHWQSELASGFPRRDRRGCDYDAYVPDPLVGRTIALDGDVAADVADAERAITELNFRASVLVDTEALARLLLRAESVASSKIEGLEVGGRRLMRAEAARELGEESSDVTAAEILGNIDAMAWAIEGIEQSGTITLQHLLDTHRRLLAGTRLHVHAGEIRTTQKWIGGSDYTPCSAAFVPSPPGMVPELLHDLIEFCNRQMLLVR